MAEMPWAKDEWKTVRDFIMKLDEKMELLTKEEMAERYLNEGCFLRWWKEACNEILAVAHARRLLHSWMRLTQGLDIDALKVVSKGVNYARWRLCAMIITTTNACSTIIPRWFMSRWMAMFFLAVPNWQSAGEKKKRYAKLLKSWASPIEAAHEN